MYVYPSLNCLTCIGFILYTLCTICINGRAIYMFSHAVVTESLKPLEKAVSQCRLCIDNRDEKVISIQDFQFVLSAYNTVQGQYM